MKAPTPTGRSRPAHLRARAAHLRFRDAAAASALGALTLLAACDTAPLAPATARATQPATGPEGSAVVETPPLSTPRVLPRSLRLYLSPEEPPGHTSAPAARETDASGHIGTEPPPNRSQPSTPTPTTSEAQAEQGGGSMGSEEPPPGQ